MTFHRKTKYNYNGDEMDRIYIIDKPEGLTSHDVVSKVRKILGRKSVGHTGTLDPFATGLLLVLSDEATKVARFLEAHDKTYLVKLKLGSKTDTGDLTGKVIETREVKNLDIKDIREVFNSFLGESEQIPPMYSAIKINGKKLYELARKGQEVERKPRKIEITRLDLISYEDQVLTFEVDCSSGTYVRTLGEDIANRLDTVGNLISLRRVRIGKFTINMAINIDDINEDNGLSIMEALKEMPAYKIYGEEERDVLNGRPLKLPITDKYVLMVSGDGILKAIYYRDNDCYRSLRGFNLCK